jgi:hypothetical protein
MKRIIVFATVLSACSPAPGRWFLSLEAVGTARYVEVADRAVAPGWQKLSNDWQLHLTRGSLAVTKVELLSLPEAAAAFDPADPPPGYGPCHNGHCHAPDGRLVPYDEVAAATSGTAPALALTLAGATWDLLAPVTLPLACADDCHMGHGRIDRARVSFGRLALSGEVRPDPTSEGRPFDLVLEGQLPPLTAPLDLPADNQHPPRAALTLALEPGAHLLDSVDWTAPLGDLARAAITERLAEIPFSINLHRSH